MKQFEQFLKLWGRYDKETYNAMKLYLDSQGILKKRGQVGDLLSKSKRNEKKVKEAFDTLKEQFGRASQQEKIDRAEYRQFKEDHPNAKVKSVKDFKEFRRMNKTLDQLLSYAYNHYDQSEVGNLEKSMINLVEIEKIETVLEWLNDYKNDFSQGFATSNTINFETTYNDVESMFT